MDEDVTLKCILRMHEKNVEMDCMAIPLAARSKVWVCGRSFAGIAGSNPAEDMSVSCDCCVLSGRRLCFGLITCPEEFYRVWCI
jgi:hypothetical protein